MYPDGPEPGTAPPLPGQLELFPVEDYWSRVRQTVPAAPSRQNRQTVRPAATLQWAVNGQRSVTTVSELEGLLHDLEDYARGSEPFIAELTLENGDSLSVGLGLHVTNLSFVSASEMPPYYTSAGLPASGSAVFFYFGHWSEFSADTLVPMDIGRRVMCEFFETGRLPATIKWEQV